MLTRLKRRLRKGSAELEIGPLSIRDVRPVRALNAGSATNKANRLVLRGDADGRPVKIYEAASAAHADFIERVSHRGADTLRFPEVFARSGRFLVCSWMEGEPLSGGRIGTDTLQKLVELQSSLHALDIGPAHESGFDYWRDVIAPRFRRAADLMSETPAAERAIAVVDEWRAATAPTINHPDLSLDNVIQTTAGNHVPIDNELLYRGPGAFMDILNTMNSLPKRHRAAYLDAYEQTAGARALPEAEVAKAFWLARRAGSFFVAGQLAQLTEAFETADDDLLSAFPAS